MPQNVDHMYRSPDQPLLLNVASLFAEDRTYIIPKWQRDYSWDADEEVRLLLEDLEAFCGNPSLPNYVLGSFITYTNGSDQDHYVVDGQQRLVTLYVLTLAIRDCLKLRLAGEYSTGAVVPRGLANQLSSIERICLRTGLDGTDSIPMHLEFGDATLTLKKLADGQNSALILEQTSQLNIYAAYEACVRYIDAQMLSAFEVAQFARAVLSGTYLTENIVDNVKQALEIFLKINIRGKELEGSDYLKNYLFRNVDPSIDFDDLASVWELMSNNLRSSITKREKLKKPEFFLRNWALVLNGEKIGGDNAVFNFWENRFDLSPQAMSSFLELAPTYSKNFSRISANKLISVNEYNVNLEGADFFKGTQYFPVLLAGAHLENYSYLSELVNYRYLFYILTQERTQEFESMIPKWAKEIAELSPSAPHEEIDDKTRLAHVVLLNSMQIEAFRNRVLSYRYGSDTRRIRMLLAVVSKNIQERAGYDDLSLKQILKGYKNGIGFDIDHILPQAKILSRRDPTVPDQNQESQRVMSIYNSIGNLVLVNGLQRLYGEKDPIEKAGLYVQDSLIFTKSLSHANLVNIPVVSDLVVELQAEMNIDLDNWSETDVEKRGKFIVNKVIDLIPGVLKSND